MFFAAFLILCTSIPTFKRSSAGPPLFLFHSHSAFLSLSPLRYGRQMTQRLFSYPKNKAKKGKKNIYIYWRQSLRHFPFPSRCLQKRERDKTKEDGLLHFLLLWWWDLSRWILIIIFYLCVQKVPLFSLKQKNMHAKVLLSVCGWACVTVSVCIIWYDFFRLLLPVAIMKKINNRRLAKVSFFY